MKRLLLIAGLALASFGAYAQGSGIQWQISDMLSGQNVAISNNVTYTNNTVGVAYLAPTWIPVTTGYTNSSSGALGPDWSIPAMLWPNVNGDLNTNLSIEIVMNNTNVVRDSRQTGTPVGAQSNGYATNWVTPISASTNTMTFTFVRISDTYTNIPLDTWTLTFAAPGTTPKTIVTNIPSSFLAGSRQILLQKVVANDVGATSVNLLNKVALVGWKP